MKKRKTKNPGTIMFTTSPDGRKCTIWYPGTGTQTIPREAVIFRIATANLQGEDVIEVDDKGDFLNTFEAIPTQGYVVDTKAVKEPEVEDLLEGIEIEEDLLAEEHQTSFGFLKAIASSGVSDNSGDSADDIF